MGFSGGGSNVLLPHTHDGTVSQDGGPLNFNNITQSQSAAGEIFYSDGVHLQQLVYPAVPAGETLQAAALSTAPSWGAAAPAPVAAYTFLDYFEQTVAGASMDLSWASLSFDDISTIQIYFNLQNSFDPNDVELQYSTGGALVTTNTYATAWSVMGSGTPGSSGFVDSWIIHELRDRKRCSGWVQLTGATSNIGTATSQTMGICAQTSDSAPAGRVTAGTQTTQLAPQTCDGIRLQVSGGSSIQIGSYISAFSTSTS